MFVGVWACVTPHGDVEGKCRVLVSSGGVLWWDRKFNSVPWLLHPLLEGENQRSDAPGTEVCGQALSWVILSTLAHLAGREGASGFGTASSVNP